MMTLKRQTRPVCGWLVCGHRLGLRPIGCTPALCVTWTAPLQLWFVACGAIQCYAFVTSRPCRYSLMSPALPLFYEISWTTTTPCWRQWDLAFFFCSCSTWPTRCTTTHWKTCRTTDSLFARETTSEEPPEWDCAVPTSSEYAAKNADCD